ncbi:MFS transporter [Propioniciclava sp. MC1595]|uniref:MFS transporter n=1 Tax=Propioniciclava sp. MC1595 TaxID=2760308 RepID=UPI001AA13C27|nr:MFS transporter [Propioniciclava sp. MC1595]QTE25850.1 MFS transporter [Propioniciclava sp. MC1595]
MGIRSGLRSVLADTRPLRQPDFRRLWTANIITVIGAQLTVVAVPAQIYAITGSSGMVGLTGLFGLVPLVIFGLWGGALADHLDRRTLLEITTIGLVVTSGLFALQAFLRWDNVWVLLGLFALQQAFFAVNQPTRTAVLPKLLPVAQLPAANALNMTVFSAGAIAGPLVGGALIPVLGYAWLYLVDTITLFATLYAVYRLPRMPVDNPQGSPGLRAVWDGLVYLSAHKILLMSFVVDIIAMVFGMPRALFPQLAHEAFGGPAEGGLAFALLFAGIPAGAVLGGVLSGWVSRVRREGLAIMWAIAVWGVAMTVMGVAVWFAPLATGAMLGLAVAMLVVGGAADMSSAAFRQSLLLGATDDAVRGRLQGVFIVVVAGGPRIADILHGGAAEVVGPAVATAGGGVLVLVGIAVVALLYPRFHRFRLADR